MFLTTLASIFKLQTNRKHHGNLHCTRIQKQSSLRKNIQNWTNDRCWKLRDSRIFVKFGEIWWKKKKSSAKPPIGYVLMMASESSVSKHFISGLKKCFAFVCLTVEPKVCPKKKNLWLPTSKTFLIFYNFFSNSTVSAFL